MATVLYLSGWGRSGTTILAGILGAYPGVCNVGELYHLWQRGLISKRLCGCGAKLPDCDLWQDILDEAYGADRPDPRQVVQWQKEAARARHTSRLLDGQHPLADVTARLYQAIGTVTDADVIVDSSKVPSGAALLASHPEIPSYLLHVVRDPRAVAYSWQRPKLHRDQGKAVPMMSHSTLDSTLKWSAWNLLSARMAWEFRGRQRRLRYEDFVAKPQETVESLLTDLDVPTEPSPFVSDHEVRLAGDHTVSGNPDRFNTGTVKLRPDDAWRERLPARSRRTVTAVAAPLMVRYGYPLRKRRRRF